MKKSCLFLLFIFCSAIVFGQTNIHVKGKIVNENGKEIEYVSLGILNDSIGTVTDRHGRFSIDIPKWKHANITLTHIAYKTCIVLYSQYCNRNDSLIIHMKEDDHALNEVQVTGNKFKNCQIKGSGIKFSFAQMGFVGTQNKGKEVGSVISTRKKTYAIKQVSVPVRFCTYAKCILRMNVYDITEKGTFHNILLKPVYIEITKTSKAFTEIIKPKEDIILEPNKKFYVSLEFIDSDGNGSLFFPVYMKKSFLRYQSLGKFKSIPANIGMRINGMEF